MKYLDKIMRNWTKEQWDAAERVENEANALLGEVYANVSGSGLVTLVIEERKRDPATTLENVLELSIILGVETFFRLRHGVHQKKEGTACIVSPDVAALAKLRHGKKRGVRVVGVPGNRHGRAGVSIKEA